MERHIKRLNPLFQAGLEFQKFFRNKKRPFCCIGGLAVIRWGEIRITQDIDLCLHCGFGNEEKTVSLLLDAFDARIDDPVEFAVKNRVVLLSASNGVSADISLSGLPFEETMIQRASPFNFHPKCSLITCSAEDLIILKAFADRNKDWSDVEGVISRYREKLDREYIIMNLAPLCELKESPEIMEHLKRLFQ